MDPAGTVGNRRRGKVRRFCGRGVCRGIMRRTEPFILELFRGEDRRRLWWWRTPCAAGHARPVPIRSRSPARRVDAGQDRCVAHHSQARDERTLGCCRPTTCSRGGERMNPQSSECPLGRKEERVMVGRRRSTPKAPEKAVVSREDRGSARQQGEARQDEARQDEARQARPEKLPQLHLEGPGLRALRSCVLRGVRADVGYDPMPKHRDAAGVPTAMVATRSCGACRHRGEAPRGSGPHPGLPQEHVPLPPGRPRG